VFETPDINEEKAGYCQVKYIDNGKAQDKIVST